MKALSFASATSTAAALFGLICVVGDAHAQTIQLKASHHDAIGTPIDLGMNRLVRLVDERSNGRIKITLFPANQLGSEPQGVEGMSLGQIDLGAVVGATYGAFIEEANVLGMLYTFRNVDHMQKAMNGLLGKVLSDKLLAQMKIRMLDGTWYFGTRQITAKKAINTPNDLAGLKLRVVPVPVYRVGWTHMGATATPIVGADLFSAIQTGVVDAQENPPPISKGYGILQVHNHLMLSNHVIANVAVAMSEATWQRLNPADRGLIQQAAKDAGEFQKKTAIAAEATVIEEFRKAGGKVIEPDLEAFRAKAAGIPSVFMGGKFKELYSAVRAIN